MLEERRTNTCLIIIEGEVTEWAELILKKIIAGIFKK